MRLSQNNHIIRVTQYHALVYIVSLLFGGVGSFQVYQFFQADTGASLLSKELLIPALFVLIPLGIILFVQRHVVVLDQSARTLSVTKKSCIKTNTQAFSFDEVKAIEIEEKVDRGSKGTTTSYPIYAMLKTGTSVHLIEEAGKSGAFALNSHKNEQQIGKQLADAVGVPLNERRMPTIVEAISAIKDGVQSAIEKNPELKNRS